MTPSARTRNACNTRTVRSAPRPVALVAAGLVACLLAAPAVLAEPPRPAGGQKGDEHPCETIPSDGDIPIHCVRVYPEGAYLECEVAAWTGLWNEGPRVMAGCFARAETPFGTARAGFLAQAGPSDDRREPGAE